MDLKKLAAWLSAFPGFQGMDWAFDCLPHRPGLVTLTPEGIQTMDTIEDVMGNRKKTMQFTCQVAFSGTDCAQMLVDFQHWVEAFPPQLGMGRKTAALRDGRHLQKNKLGLDLYTAQLKMTYEIYYEVNENGEN